MKSELEKILEGEHPYDIFVRWKPLHEQPIGWEPNLDNGVRINIRPFMTATTLSGRRRNACILRVAPKIKWDKDRGKLGGNLESKPRRGDRMAHTFANLLTHLIFSTKDRVPTVRPEFKADLWAYLGGITRGTEGQALIVGGTADHAHLLVWLPPALAVSDCLRVLKANSSRWMHETHSPQSEFAWQTG